MAMWAGYSGVRQGADTAGPEAPAAAGAEAGSSAGADEEEMHELAKVLRIGSMVSQLLAEVRDAPLDEAGRRRLRDIHETSVRELGSVLSPDLAQELSRMALPFDRAAPSGAELRVAHAQLVGWLQGVAHGIQASIFAQQLAAEPSPEGPRAPAVLRGTLPPMEHAPSPGAGAYL